MDSGVLSLPYSLYEPLDGWQNSFNGFYYFQVDTVGGFTEIGRVNHNDLMASVCENATEPCDYALFWNQAFPQRSVFMRDATERFIYTLSDVGMKVTTDSDPGTTISSFSF